MVPSKSSEKVVAKSQKKVSFAKNLVQHSPIKTPPRKEKISFGAFTVLADDSPGNLVFGNTDLQSDIVHNQGSHTNDDRVLRPCMQRSPAMQVLGENHSTNAVDQEIFLA